MMEMKHSESCRPAIIKLNILTLASQYVLSLINFMINNLEQFTLNSSIYKKPMRHGRNIHVPQSPLAMWQTGVYYMGIQIFYSLPDYLIDLVHDETVYKRSKRHFKP
jgi:hypothetical protein